MHSADGFALSKCITVKIFLLAHRSMIDFNACSQRIGYIAHAKASFRSNCAYLQDGEGGALQILRRLLALTRMPLAIKWYIIS